MKKFICLLTALSIVTTLSACGGKNSGESDPTGANEPSVSAPAEQVTIKIGHTLANEHPVQKALEQMKARVEELSGGQMTLDLYPNSVLGNEASMVEQVISGSLDAQVQTGLSTFSNYNGIASIESVPFLWTSAESARKALDGEFGDKLAAEVIDPIGVKVINYWEQGYRHMTNNIRPIVVPADMVGIKFRTAEIPARIKMFETLGASAIPIGFNELFTALQQGTVDGQENPVLTIASSNFDEVQTYLSLTGHLFNSGCLIINPARWDNLTQEQQDILQQAANEARDAERKMIDEQESNTLEDLESKGMEVNEVDKTAFSDALKGMYNEYGDQYGYKWLELATMYND